VRAYVLRRDDYLCRIGLEGICTLHATEVDHIREVAFYGPNFDPKDLRAACGPCNHHLGGKVPHIKARLAAAAAMVGPSRVW
jgi:5-methylcytosine-specific restriction endonuclease McrA